jgi:hypothetical protein
VVLVGFPSQLVACSRVVGSKEAVHDGITPHERDHPPTIEIGLDCHEAIEVSVLDCETLQLSSLIRDRACQTEF